MSAFLSWLHEQQEQSKVANDELQVRAAIMHDLGLGVHLSSEQLKEVCELDCFDDLVEAIRFRIARQ